MNELARFIFETGMLKKMRRTGFPFLGSGGESIADHSFRAALIGYQLALTQPGLDAPKVALMLLHHDLAEARTGDLNYVNKRYATAHEEKALQDQAAPLPEPVARRYLALMKEYEEAQTEEAKLAHDADQLDMIVELKEQQDLGNPYASQWLEFALKRLITRPGRELAQAVLKTDWSEWWFEKREDWWVPGKV